jgi:hypothetical protein
MNNGLHVGNLACVQFHPRIKNMHTEAQVTTASGQIYLKKLCRHFAHKVPEMCLVIDIEDTHEVADAERVVTEHLLRLVRGDTLDVRWVRSEQ